VADTPMRLLALTSLNPLFYANLGSRQTKEFLIRA
jgi:hypothetical protein